MEKHCDICNRSVEAHLANMGKSLCFSCLTEQVDQKGSIPAFGLKQKPIQAPCAVCEVETSGTDLVPSPWGFMCKNCCDICQTQSGVTWDIVTIAAQKEWLIKSNTKILGPYTSNDVDAALRDHRIVAHDEIMRPAGRWRLLRDEEQFHLVINEVKNRLLAKKSAEVTASGTGDLTDEFVMPDRVSQTDHSPEVSKSSGEVEAILIDEEPEETRDLIKSYGTKKEFQISPDLSRLRKRRFWLGLILLFVSAVFFVLRVTQPLSVSVGSRDIHFQELMENGLSAEKIGLYQRALEEYSEARTIKPDDPELLMHLAPLTLIYDKQLIQSQRMFRQLLETLKEPDYQKVSLVGLGLVSMESHDFDSALEDFERVRTIDNEFLPAIVNLGIVHFYRNNYRLAEDLLLKSLEKGASDGAIVMSLSDVYLEEAAEASVRTKKMVSVHELLDRYLELTHDYQQEVLIQYAKVLTFQGRPTEAAKKIESFLDVDPEETDNHTHDWMIYRGRASWGLLLESLKKISTTLTPSPRLNAALGLAMYRGREKLEGAQTIEQALAQSPRDPLLMALAGWVELKLGRKETGAVNIKQAALGAENYKLPHVLQARLCQEQRDFECSRKQWEIVLKLDSRSAEALHGLALAAWSKSDKDAAQIFLTQLYANDPTYIPYLQLAREIRSTVPSDSK